VNRRRFLQLSAAGAAAVPLRAYARHSLPVRHPYGIENAVARLPAWDGATSSASVPGSMRMFRGNLTHTYYGSGTVPDQPRLAWRFRMADYPTTLRDQPIVWKGTGWTGQALKYGDYVFVGSTGGHFHCFEALTGKLVWVYAAERMFKGSPALYKNRIYVPNVDNHLRCLDAATGALIWDWCGDYDMDSSPRIYDGMVYVGGEDGDLKCFDAETGVLQWKHEFGVGTGDEPGSTGIECSLAIVDGIAYFGHLDGKVRAFALRERRLLWERPLGVDVDASCLIAGDRVYVGVEDGAGAPTFHCLERATGKPIWARDVPTGIWSSAALWEKHVIVGGNDGKLYCLDATTGNDAWVHDIGARTWCSPQVVDGKVLFGAFDNDYRIVEAATGKLIGKIDLGERCISAAAVEGGHIWVGTGSGYFYCLGA